MIGLHQRAMAKRSRSASMTAPTKLRPTPASPTSTPNPARPTNWVKISPKTDTETPHTATAVPRPKCTPLPGTRSVLMSVCLPTDPGSDRPRGQAHPRFRILSLRRRRRLWLSGVRTASPEHRRKDRERVQPREGQVRRLEALGEQDPVGLRDPDPSGPDDLGHERVRDREGRDQDRQVQADRISDVEERRSKAGRDPAALRGHGSHDRADDWRSEESEAG